MHKAYPDKFGRENLLRVLNYVLGCHPASNTSLVSAVGAKSMTVAYGINLNDWTHIPGGGVSGPSLIRPDFPELKEPFPFLWQQAEYVLTGPPRMCSRCLPRTACSTRPKEEVHFARSR